MADTPEQDLIGEQSPFIEGTAQRASPQRRDIGFNILSLSQVIRMKLRNCAVFVCFIVLSGIGLFSGNVLAATTTVMLQVPGTENMADSYIRQNSPILPGNSQNNLTIPNYLIAVIGIIAVIVLIVVIMRVVRPKGRIKIGLAIPIIVAMLYFVMISYPAFAATNVSQCKVLNSANEVYDLTTSFSNSTAAKCLDIEAQNVTLDCHGYTVTGFAGGNTAIYVNASNATVKNCVGKDFEHCIYAESTGTNLTVQNNTMLCAVYGVYSTGQATIIKNNNFTLNNPSSYGIELKDSNNHIVENNTFDGTMSTTDVLLYNANYTNITLNTFKETVAGYTSRSIYLYGGYYNIIYNNFFNLTNYITLGGSETNYWNVTKQYGSRIYGSGTVLGGNYYANWSGTGFSQTCTDTNQDGLCDSAYTLGTNNVDSLPMSLNFTQHAPTTSSARVYSTTNTTAVPLQGFCIGTDPDYEPLLYYCNWYLNGTLNSTSCSAIYFTQGVETNVANISGSSLYTGNWSLGCKAFDGTANSTQVNSTNVTISVASDNPPTYTNFGSNISSPKINEYINFYSQWSDDNALDKYIFSWNGTGASCNTWANDTAVSFQSGNWTNTTKQMLTACAGKVVGYKFYGNDSAGQWNATGINTITITDDPPTYSLNSTNSTLAGTYIKHSLYWQDDINLSGYIFSFCNGTWNGTDCLSSEDGEVTYEYYTTYTFMSDEPAYGIGWSAQTFTIGNTGNNVDFNLTAIDTILYKEGTPGSTYNASIRAVNGSGWPTGSDLCFGYTNSSNVPTYPSYGYVRINITGCQLNASTQYALVLRGYGTPMNWFRTYVDREISVYTGGKYFISADSGSSWGIIYDGDMYFHIYGNGSVTGWVNDSWVPMMGSENWSNVTKLINSTVGANIAWCVYTNDSSENWNSTSCANPFTYVTTGSLSVDSVVNNGPKGFGYNITVNATITNTSAIDTVVVNVMYPNSTSINYTMQPLSSNVYSTTFTDTWTVGGYDIIVYANDTIGLSDEYPSYFNVSVVGYLDVFTINSSYTIGDMVNLTDPPPTGDLAEEEQPLPDDPRDRIKQPPSDDYITAIVTFKSEALSPFEKRAQQDLKNNPLSRIPLISSVVGWLTDVSISGHNAEIESQQDYFLRQVDPKDVTFRYKYGMNGLAIVIKKSQLDEIRKMPNVVAAWQERIANITLDDSIPLIGADNVWQQLDGSGKNITGTGIKIAILDTGIKYEHTFFRGTTTNATQSCNYSLFVAGNCTRIEWGWNFVSNNDNPVDNNKHGTHCASIAAGKDPAGVYDGVAPNATLIIYKVCSDAGSCAESWIDAAIENITARGDIDVASMSFGAGGYIDETDISMFQNAYQGGTVLVAAAGNSGSGADTMEWPGMIPYVFTVGASSDSDTIASFSSRGYGYYENNTIGGIKPDVTAPGVSITAADYANPNGGTATYSGTSMACPHVAGLVALLRQSNESYTPQQIKSMIAINAKNIGYTDDVQGSGRIQAFNAYNSSAWINPYNYYFGSNLNSSVSVWNASGTFSLTNMLGSSQSFNLTVSTSDFNYTLSSTNLTLSAYQTQQFTVNVTWNNSVTGYGYKRGILFVNSTTANQSFRIPLMFYIELNDPRCPSSGTVVSASTTLAGNISCYYSMGPWTSVMFVNNSNVVLDCNHSTLIGPNAVSKYAIEVNGTNNVTVKNCNISTFGYEVIVIYSTNTTVTNNTFYNSKYWVITGETDNIDISNNYFRNPGWDIDYPYFGVGFSHSNNTNIHDNTFQTSFYIASAYNFWFETYSGANIYNNIINQTRFTLDVQRVLNTHLWNNTYNDVEYAGAFFSSPNVTIENTTIMHGSTFDAYNLSFGYIFTHIAPWYPDSPNQIVRNLNYNGTKYGIYAMSLFTQAEDSVFTSYMGPSIMVSYGMWIGEEITIVNGSARLVNCTYDSEKVDAGNLTRAWWANVNTTNQTNGQPLDATIKVYTNETGSWVLYGQYAAGANGIANKVIVPQYINKTSGATNYTVNITASKRFYYSNSTLVTSASNIAMVNFTLMGGAPDDTPPVLAINIPQNTTYNTTTLTFSLTCDEDCDWAGYSLDGAGNVTMSNTSTTSWYKQLTFTDETSHSVKFWANDTIIGNMGNSSTIYFTVNTNYTPPSSDKSMINNTGSTDFKGYLTMKVQKNITGTWTDEKTITNNILYNISAGNTLALDTIWAANGSYTTNETGTFRVLAEFKDPSGNVLLTDGSIYLNSTYIFDIDSTPPDISWNTPTNNTVTANTTLLGFNATISETGGSAILNINGTTNYTMSWSGNYAYYTFNGANQTTYCGRIYANDTSGNLNLSSSRCITVNLYSSEDTTPPSITWNTPANNSYTSNVTWIYWNTSISETPNKCLLNNGTANFTMTISGLYCYYNMTGLVNQTKYCSRVYANDTTGNLNFSSQQCATINLTDLPIFCGDSICNGAETCSTCSADCGECGGGGGGGGSYISSRYARDDGVCETDKGETVANSPDDCKAIASETDNTLPAIFIIILAVIIGWVMLVGGKK